MTRRVVKNVAGYDAHKLHIGALGTLGVIVEVTLKLFPLPERETTLLIGYRDQATALALCDRLRTRPLAPVSLVLLDHRRPTAVFDVPPIPHHPSLLETAEKVLRVHNL